MDRGKDDTGGKILKQIADLHIHSRYSMATSKDGTPEMLDLWARKKGITLLGTGDMTHPIWRQGGRRTQRHHRELPGAEG